MKRPRPIYVYIYTVTSRAIRLVRRRSKQTYMILLQQSYRDFDCSEEFDDMLVYTSLGERADLRLFCHPFVVEPVVLHDGHA